MEIAGLITEANGINNFIRSTDMDEVMIKELRKMEMYCRKTYLMLTHLSEYQKQDAIDSAAFLTNLNIALVRDQKYIKARDSLEDYEIAGAIHG